MDRFRADIRQIDKLNIAKQGAPIPPPGRASRRLSSEERTLLNSIVAIGGPAYPPVRAVGDLFTVADRPTFVDVLAPSSVPVGMAAASSPRYSGPTTIGLGLEHSMFAGVGYSLQAGFYGSTVREVGVFVCGAGGIWTNAGVGIGPALTIVFGPPSDFAGVSWGIGMDAGPDIVSGSAMLLFSAPPVRVLGFCFALAIGVSALPCDLTVQVAYTEAKPFLKF